MGVGEYIVPKGICKGCKKVKELNRSGYCNVGNTLRGACNAESFGMAVADRAIGIVEAQLAKYIPKSAIRPVLACIVILAFIAYYFAT